MVSSLASLFGQDKNWRLFFRFRGFKGFARVALRTSEEDAVVVVPNQVRAQISYILDE